MCSKHKRTKRLGATLLSTMVIVSMIAMVAAVGIAPVAADQHTKDQAPDKSDSANFTVNLPFTTDHYPGDQNEENGSIQYFAAGDQAFEELDAEEGVWFDYIIIDADWIDYSACDTENTAAFGIDRGNNNSGTQYDEDLVQKQKSAEFRDDGITVNFFNHDDVAGDPPYMAAEDAIVAEQGARSAGGACLTMTSEPGWYQVQGFANGTVADNGPDEEPSDSAEEVGMNLNSNYIYVCECDSEEEAREKLGPPPNEEASGGDSGEETATPDDSGGEETATPDDSGGTGEETATDDSGGEETATPDDSGGEETATPDDSGGTGEETATDDSGGTGEETATDEAGGAGVGEETETDGGVGGGDETPTGDDGPGFGPIVALIALLAAAGLVNRRE